MDFELREEEQAVADLAREIIEDQATNERLKELEAGGQKRDDKLWSALAEANLLGTAIPAAHGGSELGFVALCALLREVGRGVAPVPVYPSLVLGALPLARFGSEAQQGEWLPGVATGEKVLTAALTEFGSSDPLSPRTRAEARGDAVLLTGAKDLVPAAAEAARVLIPARHEGGEIGLYYVDPTGEGVRLEAQGTPDGQPQARLVLDGAPATGRLGGGGESLRWIVEHATAARCVMQLGVTERALEMTATYSRERVQFGRPIGSFQAVHQRAADAYIHVEAIRLSAWEAVWRLAEDLPASDGVAIAKFWAAEGGQLAAYACQHLHGGIGIDRDYALHRYFLWAIQFEHELGSARHQLDRIGRSIASQGLPPT
ncbi:MAG: acyl-CoA dehydrogenase family protein [Myxococcota bacterium]|nr:acyl-CoA dehydrogenase family protein [Myxococcota bacterium]